MARDLAEQERAFIESLQSDTGRDLAAWMLAIGQSGLGARNDIIDWLRHQGFHFSNASWLERIHHNGGRLIYAGGEDRLSEAAPQPRNPARALTSAAPTAERAPPATEPRYGENEPASYQTELRPPVALSPQPAAVAPVRDAAEEAEVTALLLTAKGLRPLAEALLREMDQLVPGLVRSSAPPFVSLASPMPFAALLPGPKELRLFADFGPTSRDRARKADKARYASPFPDVIVLSDARQLDERLRELIADAYTRALH